MDKSKINISRGTGSGKKRQWVLEEKGKAAVTFVAESHSTHFYSHRSFDEATLAKEPEALNYAEVEPMLDFLGYNQKEAASFLEVDPGTITRWKRSKTEIGKLRTLNLMNVDQIIGKGIRIFGSEVLFKEWLHTSNDALGDVKPVDLLKDPFGVSLVEEAIDALSWGSFV